MKKLICLLLALGVLLALMAGCKDQVIGDPEPTTVFVGEDALAGAIEGMNLDPDAINAEFEAAMKRAMELNVTVPDDEPPAQTMPPPMPTGVPIRPEDVYPLMERTRAILNSGSYMLKGRSSSPPPPACPSARRPSPLPWTRASRHLRPTWTGRV
jgi:hypothetical protein